MQEYDLGYGYILICPRPLHRVTSLRSPFRETHNPYNISCFERMVWKYRFVIYLLIKCARIKYQPGHHHSKSHMHPLAGDEVHASHNLGN